MDETITKPLITATFCDDIRQEIGFKFSLIGCYSGEMILDKVPIALPKLCAMVTILTPAENLLTQITLRAYYNDEQLAELEIPMSRDVDLHKKVAAESGLGRLSLRAAMTFSPLVITEPGKLRIEAATDAGLIRGSYLTVRLRKPEDPPLL